MDHIEGCAARGPGVGDVMTRTVVTVVRDTPYREVVGTMIARDLDAIPVIDHVGHPVGVIADGDLLPKLEFRCGTSLPPLVAGPRTRVRWRKATGLTAADMMTTPVAGVAAGRLAGGVPGVLAVRNNLRHDFDDLHITGL